MEKNNVRISKVPLGEFIDILVDLYDRGVDFVDIIGIVDGKQDSIGISFSEEYMNQEMKENFNEIPIDIKIDNNKIDDGDINQLI